MKRTVTFTQDQDKSDEAELQQTNVKRQRNNAGKPNGSGFNYKAKKKEMLEFRKQLPIYSGTQRSLPFYRSFRSTDTDCLGRDAIIKAIRNNSSVIVMGETGSGKTTREFKFNNWIAIYQCD